MEHGHHSHSAAPQREIPAPQTKWIWQTFWILLAITAVEFIIAFAKGPLHLNHYLVVFVFVALTIVKAFYIVANFMHLAHETKALILSILIPIIFIMWFILAMLIEGTFVNHSVYHLFK